MPVVRRVTSVMASSLLRMMFIFLPSAFLIISLRECPPQTTESDCRSARFALLSKECQFLYFAIVLRLAPGGESNHLRRPSRLIGYSFGVTKNLSSCSIVTPIAARSSRSFESVLPSFITVPVLTFISTASLYLDLISCSYSF